MKDFNEVIQNVFLQAIWIRYMLQVWEMIDEMFMRRVLEKEDLDLPTLRERKTGRKNIPHTVSFGDETLRGGRVTLQCRFVLIIGVRIPI